ncbi:septation protein IspZ [Aquirhabdus sp.]|uniref:septation protein IspZ n=1 Tax=Aquirhabdus sp. TaxID=2824160 RepID=UPI00396C9751
MKALLDFVPLVVFFFLAKTQTIFVATQGLIIASVVIYGLHFALQKGRLEKGQWITLLLTLAFGGLTLYLRDDMWLRWKSPIINWIFGTAFLLSPIVGKNPIPLVQRFLDQVFELSSTAWKKLNLTWAVFFYFLGTLHLIFAFTFPKFWIDFKVFGGTAIMIIFMVGQFILLRKHLKTPENQN